MITCAFWSIKKFLETYKVCGPRNTKAGKADAKAAQAVGLEPITAAQFLEAAYVKGAIRAHPVANELFSNGQPEVSVYGEDAGTGLKVKGKLDWLDGDRVVDLKTVGRMAPALLHLQSKSPRSNTICRQRIT